MSMSDSIMYDRRVIAEVDSTLDRGSRRQHQRPVDQGEQAAHHKVETHPPQASRFLSLWGQMGGLGTTNSGT